MSLKLLNPFNFNFFIEKIIINFKIDGFKLEKEFDLKDGEGWITLVDDEHSYQNGNFHFLKVWFPDNRYWKLATNHPSVPPQPQSCRYRH